MSYKSLIEKQLVKVFNLVKDLASDIVLVKKDNVQFDFNTGKASQGAQSTIATKAIVTDIKKQSKDRNTIEKQIMLKNAEVGDLNNYSSVVLENITWNMGPIQKNDGFILIATIYREA